MTRIRRGLCTYADYLETPDDERYELIEGKLIMAAASSIAHRRVARNFGAALWPFVRDN